VSHHASGPDFRFPRGDARLDMTDLYVFSKPGDVSKSIVILNVHPSVAVNPPGPTTAEPFAPGALHEFQFDTNGDAVADLNYSVQFSSSEDGTQTATRRRIHGARAAGFGEEGEEIVKDTPVSVGREALVTRAGDYRFFFGWRSDPFFFDANGFFNNMQFTGDDLFTDKDVCSIVLELPNSALGSREVGLWARTVDKTGEGWIQADRGGRPLQAVFLARDSKEAYLSGQPADDDRFTPRRCCRPLPLHLHKWEGGRRWCRTAWRSARRLPIPRAATPPLSAKRNRIEVTDQVVHGGTCVQRRHDCRHDHHEPTDDISP
jgi:hypothetical protein